LAIRASALLKRLEGLKDAYGNDARALKLELLRQLDRRRLATARQVHRLHEVLCFLRAYPDDRALLAQVEQMLAGFAARADLRRHRGALADSGIAGTEIRYRFYWSTARWLARRWADRLSIDWREFGNRDRVEDLLPVLLPYSETLTLDDLTYPPRQWLQKVKGPGETDAAFLIRRFESLPGDGFTREKVYEDLDVPIRLVPGQNTPSRTHARYSGSPVVYRSRPLVRSRPRLREAVLGSPVALRPVSAREGRVLIDLAREAMVARGRDLDIFCHADPNDVRLADCGGGLEFACIGGIPERRLLLEAVYGFLILSNGVPVGYLLASGLFRSSEVAYNVFDTYRGAEAAVMFGHALAVVRRLLGSDTFTLDPYQLGHQNLEGLRSGAWWFYYKLGFRPVAPGVRRLVRRELEGMRAHPAHRSTIATLRKLSAEDMFWHLGRPRRDVLGRIGLGEVGLAITRYLARRFGADREAGIDCCVREAARLLGLRSPGGLTPAERCAWRRWAPLVMALPGVERWGQRERRALIEVVRAKGGRRESEFVRLFDRHARLRRAVLRLSRAAGRPGDC
jgi:hypothetical protein